MSAVNALGCEGERKAVSAVINHYAEILISVNDDQTILTSSYETGNQWYFNGEKIGGATGRTVEVDKTGLYEAEASMNGCTTRAGREMIVLGMEETPGSGVSFFPNPITDKVTIQLRRTDAETRALVYSSFGQLLGAIDLTLDGDKLTGEFNFQDQPAGLYIVRLKEGSKTINYKIVKK